MPFATITQSYEHTTVALHLQGETQAASSSTTLSPEMISRSLQFRLELQQEEKLKIIQGDQSILLDLVQVLRRYLEFELRGQPQGTFSGTVAIRPLDFIFHRLTVRQGEGIVQADLSMSQLYDLLEVVEDTAASLPQLDQLKAVKPRSNNLSPAPIAALVVGGIGLAAAVAFLGGRGESPTALREEQARSNQTQLESAVPESAPAAPPAENASEGDREARELAEPTAAAPPALRQEEDEVDSTPQTTAAPTTTALDDLSGDRSADLSLAGQELQINLATSWEAPANLSEALAYTVLVDPTGQILAASPENAAASDLQDSTPLEGISTTNPSPLPEGSERFRVLFSPEGRVRVSPETDAQEEAAGVEQSE